MTPNEEGLTIHEKPEGDALAAQEVYNRVVQSTVAITVSRTGRRLTAPARASSPLPTGISSPTPMWC